ncbi:Rv1355c family protein [Streptomyces sp. NPDC091371]|uniref:Rv1355c family protein n=1 Tax=Streptomyces sp. NPDC091371 TaxID=3155303 RepID=UPI00343792BD
MSLEAHITSATRTTTADDAEPWRPGLFDAADPRQRAELTGILDRGGASAVGDTLTEQLAELLTARRPAWRPSPQELAAAVEDHLDGRPPLEYGTWAWYPWSRRLVHVLPGPEYRELRQSRNQYKITAAEQAGLTGRTIAVAGLSVGAASAFTLAQEGVGSRFRLADFDRLSLSNLNRLRASVTDIGLPKVVIAARQMYEMDPYLDIEVWPEGLTEDNVDGFLTGGGRADLFIEECDDLYIKVFARERARAHGIAVLMETNERGMLDVERFDLEPDRPLLHGLIDGVAAADLKGLPVRDKVPHVLRILGPENLSERMAPSLMEIGHTLSSWPQLASGVALGAAVVTDTARRVLLGQFTASGRFFVDPAELIRDGAQAPVRAQAAPEPAVPPTAVPPTAASPVRAPAALAPAPPLLLPGPGGVLGEEGVRRLVAYGIQAPSGGNVQPWTFVARGPVLHCRVDETQPATLLDFEGAATRLAIGAAVENIDLAARAAGWACHARPFPDPADPALVCELTFSGAPHTPRPALVDWIERRATNRRAGPARPLDAVHRQTLTSCAADSGARLHLLTDRAELAEAGRILGAADRLRMLSRRMHAEMMGELRWTPEEVRATRDGIDIATLEADAADLAGMSLARHWPHLAFVRQMGGGRAFEEGARDGVAASSAIGCLTIAGTGPEASFEGGRALQRLWLTATSLGLGFQPVTVLLYLLARVERGDGAGLDAAETATLHALRKRLSALVPQRPEETELLLFRLSYAPPPTARALRRGVDAVLRFDTPDAGRATP